MKDFIKNNKNLLIGGAVLLLIVVLVIVIVVIARKKKIEKVPLPQETDWGRVLTDVEQAQVVRLTDALYQDMKGWNIGGHDKAIYQEYSTTSDKVFVAVANYFGEKYGNGESLAQWMYDEAYAWSALTDGILKRLAGFGFIAA